MIINQCQILDKTSKLSMWSHHWDTGGKNIRVSKAFEEINFKNANQIFVAHTVLSTHKRGKAINPVMSDGDIL